MSEQMYLTEALRLGNEGYREVLSNSQYFRLGLEYEFNVDEGVSDIKQASDFAVGTEDESNLNKFALSQAENISTVMNYEADIEDMIRALPSSSVDFEKEELFASFYYDDIVELFDAFSEITKSFTSLGLNRIEDVPKKAYEGLGVPTRQYGAKTIDFTPDEVGENTNDIRNSLLSVKQYIDKDCGNLDMSPDINEIINTISSAIQKHRNNTGSGQMAMSKTDYVKQTIPVNMSDIEGIVPDPTVYNGAEVITKPLPLKRTFELMREMFSYIKEIGDTDNSTGLHVNVSLDGFNTRNFNAVKAVTLLDPDSYQSPRKYPMRDKEMLGSLYRVLEDKRTLAILAKNYVVGGNDAFQMTFEKIITQSSNKFRNVNLTHFFGNDVNASERRLEFRYVGGNNYENRYNEIVQDIFHICYVMIAGAKRKSFTKEYTKSILRILDRAVRKTSKGELQYFTDLVTLVRDKLYQ